MANSAVSILSVSLNEEMLRANSKSDKSSSNREGDGNDQSAKDNADDMSASVSRHVRKHSLGSNVENEFSFKSTPDEEDKENVRFEPLDPPTFEGASGVTRAFSKDKLNDKDFDLDSTLIANAEDETLVENTDPPAAEEDKAAGESEGGTKKPKKKGLAWLLLH